MIACSFPIPTIKSFARFCCSALALAAVTGCTTAPHAAPSFPIPASATWAAYQSNPTHNAVVALHIPAVNWSTDLGAKINGGLALAGESIFADTFAGDVVALDARNGGVRWRRRLDNVVMSTPVIAQGMVMVGTGDNGGGGANAGFVYAPGADQSQGLFWGRNEGDHIVALDAATGAVRWSYKTAGEDMPSPIILGDRVIFANGDGNAYALSLASGYALWRTPLPGIATMASANVADGNAVVSVCGDFEHRFATLALDPHSGHVRWKSPLGNCDASPAVDGGRVFVNGVDAAVVSFGYGARTIVGALDAKTGATLWTYRTREPGPFTGVGSNERAIAGTVADRVLFQSLPTDSAVAAFAADDGTKHWVFHTMAPVKMSPLVAHGFVYVGDTAGLFYQLDERTGRLIAVKLFKQPFATAPPVLMGETMLVVNGTSVFAFPRTLMR